MGKNKKRLNSIERILSKITKKDNRPPGSHVIKEIDDAAVHAAVEALKKEKLSRESDKGEKLFWKIYSDYIFKQPPADTLD